MFSLLEKIMKVLLKAHMSFYRLKYKQPESGGVFTNSTSKTSMNGCCTLRLSATTELNKQKVDACAKEIIKKNIKTPEKLFEFIQKKGTKVYRINHADTILWLIGEEEGFVTPLKGFKALFLNLIIGFIAEQKINVSFSTKEMFVLRKLPVDIYILSHQFHKWYGFMMDLPGYDYNTQEKFKKIYKTLDDSAIRQFSLAEIISIKEAVARNVESIDFVVSLAKEYDGSKKSLAKIISQQGAKV